MTQNMIETSAELHEDSVLPGMREIHVHPVATPLGLPPALAEKPDSKTPAQWAYERVILYIRNFEQTLDENHEVAMGFVGGETGVLRIEGMGYYDPDIVTFYGTDGTGARTQMIQHVTQLNVTLRAVPRHIDQAEPVRIGFRLAKALEREADATP